MYVSIIYVGALLVCCFSKGGGGFGLRKILTCSSCGVHHRAQVWLAATCVDVVIRVITNFPGLKLIE